MTKLPITEREAEILAFVYGFVDDNKFSPTRQEIADKFKMSTSGVSYFIYQLVEKGKLRISEGKWRNIKIA